MNRREIEIGGKVRSVHFGLKVIGDCIDDMDGDPVKFMVAISQNSFKAIPLLFYNGLKYAEEREGRRFPHTLIEVTEWIEGIGLNDDRVLDVTQAFIRSLYDNVPEIKQEIDKMEDDVKKNLIGSRT